MPSTACTSTGSTRAPLISDVRLKAPLFTSLPVGRFLLISLNRSPHRVEGSLPFANCIMPIEISGANTRGVPDGCQIVAERRSARQSVSNVEAFKMFRNGRRRVVVKDEGIKQD